MTPQTLFEPGLGTLEVWPVPTTEQQLYEMLRDLFQHYWQDITSGPLLQGVAWEVRAEHPPRKIALCDGYLTVDFDHMHMHLCIGPRWGDLYRPTDPTLAQHRRTTRAEFFRRINRDNTPDTWGLRLFNGGGLQQITVLFPSPFVSDDQQFYDSPRWDRLRLWDKLRQRYMGLSSESFDRTGHRMLYP